MKEYMGFKVGDSVRLNARIGKRPYYFNGDGLMDYLFKERPTFKIHHFTGTRLGTEIYMACVKDGSRGWYIRTEDLVHIEIDNRRIQDV